MNGLITIARIVRPQGRRGEVLAELATDFPERFQTLKSVTVGKAGNDGPAGSAPKPDSHSRQFELEHSWLHKGRVVLKLAGVDSIDQANKLRGLQVMVPYVERVTLPAGSYYVHELQGCRVLEQTGREIGTVIEVEQTGGVPLLHVESGHNEVVLVPLAETICPVINTVAKLIIIEPPGELLDLNDGAGFRARLKRQRLPH